MWHTIKEFWCKYQVYSLENKLRTFRGKRDAIQKQAKKTKDKYERYRAKMNEAA